MRETLTISLPKEVKIELDRLTQEEGLTRSDVVRQSLYNYLFIRKFRVLRAKMMAKAQAQNVYTDDDVFQRVS